MLRTNLCDFSDNSGVRANLRTSQLILGEQIPWSARPSQQSLKIPHEHLRFIYNVVLQTSISIMGNGPHISKLRNLFKEKLMKFQTLVFR